MSDVYKVAFIAEYYIEAEDFQDAVEFAQTPDGREELVFHPQRAECIDAEDVPEYTPLLQTPKAAAADCAGGLEVGGDLQPPCTAPKDGGFFLGDWGRDRLIPTLWEPYDGQFLRIDRLIPPLREPCDGPENASMKKNPAPAERLRGWRPLYDEKD